MGTTGKELQYVLKNLFDYNIHVTDNGFGKLREVEVIPHLTFRPQRGTQSQGFQGKHREPRFTVLSKFETEQVSLCNRMADRSGQQNACM